MILAWFVANRSFKVSKALWNPLALRHWGTDLYGSIRASCCASQSHDAVLIFGWRVLSSCVNNHMWKNDLWALPHWPGILSPVSRRVMCYLKTTQIEVAVKLQRQLEGLACSWKLTFDHNEVCLLKWTLLTRSIFKKSTGRLHLQNKFRTFHFV